MFNLFFRRVWRWHFWAGLIACPVLLVVAVTGACYTFREEIESAVRPELVFVEPGAVRKSADELLAAVKVVSPDLKPVRLTVPADPARSVIVLVEPADGPPGQTRAVFVNPYTGEVLGDGPARTPFFTAVLTLHRSLFAGTPGRVVVELTTSWTVVLLVSGVALWWPRRSSRVWGVWLPRLRGPKYVVLRDLHTVAGIYLAPVVGLIALTGLFYTAVWLWGYNRATGGHGDFPAALRTASDVSPSCAPAAPVPVEVALAAARERWPNKSYAVQLPRKPGDAYTVTIRGDGGPSVYGMVAVDPSTGVVTADTRHENLPPLQRARVWVLPLHTGAVGGTATKALALLACVGLVGLSVSGVWMWLARRPVGRWGLPRAVEGPVPVPAVVVILLLAVLLPTVGLSLVAVLFGEWIVERIRGACWAAPPAESTSAVPVPLEAQEGSR